MEEINMKFNQNVITKVGNYKVVTTMTRVLVYLSNRLIGSAGCIRPSDFDFDSLFNFALHKSGSKIEVA